MIFAHSRPTDERKWFVIHVRDVIRDVQSHQVPRRRNDNNEMNRLIDRRTVDSKIPAEKVLTHEEIISHFFTSTLLLGF
jgi:hypothetical protein